MSDLFTSFSSVEQNIKDLRDQRIDNGKDVIYTGINGVDQAMRGIAKTDIVLLSAGSGAGKSEAASHIAYNNAKLGKKVLFLALEAEKNEFELRQIYKIFARKYFEDPLRDFGVYINYTDFYFGRLENTYDKYATECEKELAECKSLFTRYTMSEYSIDDFALDVENASDVDLIILDHLHFMNVEGKNENDAFKKTLIKIRSIVLEKKIPIIIVCQLRKESSTAFAQSVMPDISDIHGSSDIFKIATKAIMFASAKGVVDNVDNSTHRRPTLVRVVKNRIDGSIRYYTGLMVFDSSTNTYEDSYRLGNLVWTKNESGHKVEKFVELDIDQLPKWASTRGNW